MLLCAKSIGYINTIQNIFPSIHLSEKEIKVKKEEKTELQQTEETLWLFVKVHKNRIIKTADDYTIIKLLGNSGYSSILSNKFRRKKEGEDCIYFSIPSTFVMNARKSVYDVEKKQYVIADETNYPAWDFLKIVNADYKSEPHTPTAEELDDVFRAEEEKLPF